MFFSLNLSFFSFYSWISLYVVGIFCSLKVWESSSMKPCRPSPYVSPRRKSLITTEVSSVNIRYISLFFSVWYMWHLIIVYKFIHFSLSFKIYWRIAIYKILFFKCVMSNLFSLYVLFICIFFPPVSLADCFAFQRNSFCLLFVFSICCIFLPCLYNLLASFFGLTLSLPSLLISVVSSSVFNLCCFLMNVVKVRLLL